MRSPRIAVVAVAALCCCLVAFAHAAPVRETLSHETRVEYHTPDGEFAPGCARSFHAHVQDATGAPLSFNLTVTRDSSKPLISSQYAAGTAGSSTFDYCYNAAYLPLFTTSGAFEAHALLVRCQSLINESVPYQVGPSYLTLAVENEPGGGFSPITPQSVVFQPTTPWENYGTEDPRVVYDPQTSLYYLFYSAVETEPAHAPDVISRLALATTDNPRDIQAWKKYGPIIQNNGTGGGYAWSKSGALLMELPPSHKGQKEEEEAAASATPLPSLLIFGDSSIENGLQSATPSSDFLTYTYNATLFLPIRSDNFDSLLVESGPPPIRLPQSGLVFFLYNSARLGYPSAKPGWNTQYNVGFLLLDPEDPHTILYRSPAPIFSPELNWETGTPPALGLTPNVVFAEGARLVPGQAGQPDQVVFYYGAADSCVGSATITIDVKSMKKQQTTAATAEADQMREPSVRIAYD